MSPHPLHAYHKRMLKAVIKNKELSPMDQCAAIAKIVREEPQLLNTRRLVRWVKANIHHVVLWGDMQKKGTTK